MPKAKAKCPECAGSGTIINGKNGPLMRCQKCNGTGKKQKMVMVFWRYAHYPFVLASPGFRSVQGTYYCPSYSHAFTPLRVMPLKEGTLVKAALEQLEVDHKRAIEDANIAARVRLLATVPWLKI